MPRFRRSSYWSARTKRGDVRPTIQAVKRHAKKHDDIVITIGALYKGYSGYMYPEDNWMQIHHRKLNPLVRVIVHEFLHDMYPQKGENWTLKYEAILMREITIADKLYFLLDLVNKLVIPSKRRLPRLLQSSSRKLAVS